MHLSVGAYKNSRYFEYLLSAIVQLDNCKTVD